MNKRILYIIIIVGLLGIGGSSHNSHAQETRTISVRLYTVPSGADIYLDNQIIGQTPLEAELEIGTYEITFSLVGFEEVTQTYLIYGEPLTIGKSLVPQSNLMAWDRPISYTWSQSANQLRFFDYTSFEETGYFTYNLDTQELSSSDLPFNWLEDQALRDQIGIPVAPPDFVSPAFSSPSGRYVVYVDNDGAENNQGNLTIYDSQLDEYITTYIQRSPFYPPHQESHNLIWSPNEQILHLGYDCQFILLDGSETQIVCLTMFIDTDTSNEILVHDNPGILGNPSDNGFVLVGGVTFEGGHFGLWLVDIATQTGIHVPLDTVYGANFAPDGTYFYVASADGIFRVKTDDLNDMELVTADISSQWGVYRVDFSPSLEYAFIFAENAREDGNETFWLYKITAE